jgi:hypothetical protein
MTANDRQILAQRQLTDAVDPNSTVVLTLFLPIVDSRSSDWITTFSIEWPKEQVDTYETMGIDALQSLSLAIERARVVLVESGLELLWHGEVGTGIYKTVVHPFGAGFDKQLQASIDESVAAYADSLKPR